VHYFALMAVIDRGQNLFDDFRCLLLAEALFFRYLVEQLTAVTVSIKNASKDMQKKFNLLGYKKVPFLILKEFIQLQNVRMVELFENIYFIYKLLNLFLRQALFVQDLHRAQGLRLFVQAFPDLAICSSTYTRADFVKVFYESGVLLHENCSRALDGILLLVNQFLLLFL
jgi:hypothetical protein